MNTAHLKLVAAAALKRGGASAPDILDTLKGETCSATCRTPSSSPASRSPRGQSSPSVPPRRESGADAMWSAPITLTNRAGLRVGHIKTDGERISISACGSAYGALGGDDRGSAHASGVQGPAQRPRPHAWTRVVQNGHLPVMTGSRAGHPAHITASTRTPDPLSRCASSRCICRGFWVPSDSSGV
jgi:hypothetical protein